MLHNENRIATFQTLQISIQISLEYIHDLFFLIPENWDLILRLVF